MAHICSYNGGEKHFGWKAQAAKITSEQGEKNNAEYIYI